MTHSTESTDQFDILHFNEILIDKTNLRITQFKQDHRSLGDQIIENVRINGYHQCAPPILVWQNSEKPKNYDIIDGNKRFRGIEKNPKIIKVRCCIIRAKNIEKAKEIADLFNHQIHSVRSKHSNIEIMLNEMVKTYSDRRLRKDMQLSKSSKELISLLTNTSITSVNRGLYTLRVLKKAVDEEDPSFFKNGIREGFQKLAEFKLSENSSDLLAFQINPVEKAAKIFQNLKKDNNIFSASKKVRELLRFKNKESGNLQNNLSAYDKLARKSVGIHEQPYLQFNLIENQISQRQIAIKFDVAAKKIEIDYSSYDKFQFFKDISSFKIENNGIDMNFIDFLRLHTKKKSTSPKKLKTPRLSFA